MSARQIQSIWRTSHNQKSSLYQVCQGHSHPCVFQQLPQRFSYQNGLLPEDNGVALLRNGDLRDLPDYVVKRWKEGCFSKIRPGSRPKLRHSWQDLYLRSEGEGETYQLPKSKDLARRRLCHVGGNRRHRCFRSHRPGMGISRIDSVVARPKLFPRSISSIVALSATLIIRGPYLKYRVEVNIVVTEGNRR